LSKLKQAFAYGYKRHMQRPIEDESGNTLVELIMVMVLMVFFGFTIFTLIQAGSQTEQRIIDNKNAQVDARIAASYLNVRIRKNDSAGKIEIMPVEHTGENGILLKYRSFEEEYDRWIYFSDGKLLECITDPNVAPEDNLSTVIVELEGFDVFYDEARNALVTTIRYEYNGALEEINSTVKLRNTKSDGIIIL